MCKNDNWTFCFFKLPYWTHFHFNFQQHYFPTMGLINQTIGGMASQQLLTIGDWWNNFYLFQKDAYGWHQLSPFILVHADRGPHKRHWFMHRMSYTSVNLRPWGSLSLFGIWPNLSPTLHIYQSNYTDSDFSFCNQCHTHCNMLMLRAFPKAN